MLIRPLSPRHIIFSHENTAEWNLHLHLILGEQYNYLIDTGLGAFSVAPVREYLRKNDRPLIVVNTHFHFDHVWGNGALASHFIVSHALCHQILAEKWESMLSQNSAYRFGAVEKRLPDLMFSEELYFPADRIRLIYTPGHTADSVSVLDEKEKVLNVGDNIGDTPEEIVPSLDCDKSVYLGTLDRYESLDFKTCVSGHNEIMGREFINKIKKALVN